MTGDVARPPRASADADPALMRLRHEEFAFRLGRSDVSPSAPDDAGMNSVARESVQEQESSTSQSARSHGVVTAPLHVRDLVRYQHLEFIDAAYRAVLRRAPDPEGSRDALQLLEGGGSKIRLIGGLRYSPEGRACNVIVRGLWWRYGLERAFSIPFFGYALQWLVTLVRLPVLLRQHRRLEFFAAAQSAMASEAQARLQNALAASADATEEWKAELDRVDEQVRDLEAVAQADAHRADELEKAGIAEDRAIDRFYMDFEETFRGPRDEIKSRAAVYLPYVQRASAGSDESPVLDLGSGRGEWLEVLKEHGLVGRGVETSELSLAQCRDRGLDVIHAEAGEYLRTLPDHSVGAVTAMHVVEHLPFGALLELVANAARVLKPGGVLILETPNPRNILVASNTFYLDPTHRNPIPSPLLKFIVEAQGSMSAEVIELHPSSHEWTGIESDLDRYLVANMFGPQDYAVIAYKHGDSVAK